MDKMTIVIKIEMDVTRKDAEKEAIKVARALDDMSDTVHAIKHEVICVGVEHDV